MTPQRFVVEAFVNTFGITRPAAGQETAAGPVIALMLSAVAIVLGLAGWMLRAAFSR